MSEQRRAYRDKEIRPLISCLVELPDGTVLEGMMRDLSDTGARVSGETAGLEVGMGVRAVLVVQSDQKVFYEGKVKHVDTDGRSYGLAFTYGPELMKTNAAGREKRMCCGHEQDTPFCGYCGKELSTLHDAGV